MTQVGVEGRVVDAAGASVAGETVELFLPAGYGLAGMDRAWGAPSDYGHRDARAVVVTGEDGRFSHLFPPTTYSVSFLLIPPLGSLPRTPPPPALGVRTLSTSSSWLVVSPQDEAVSCRIVDAATNSMRDDDHVAGSASVAAPREAQEHGGWRFDLVIRRP
jgi:hypothetical protein